MSVRNFVQNSHRLLGRFDIISGTIVAAALLLCIAFLTVVRPDPERLSWLLPEHRVSSFDSTPQRYAYYVFLAALVAGALLLPLLRNLFPAGDDYRHKLAVRFVLLGLAVACLASLARLHEGHLYILLVALAAYLAHRGYKVILALFVAAIALVSLIPGIAGSPVLTIVEFLGQNEHYEPFFSQGDRLATGEEFFKDIYPYYGLLFPTIVGMFTKSGHALSILDQWRLVQVVQIAGYLLFLGAAWMRTSESPVSGRLLALLLVSLCIAPWLSTAGESVIKPTQSAVRFLFLPVSVLVLCWTERTSATFFSLCFGFCAACALITNLEAGIVVTGGMALAWLVRMRGETFGGYLRALAAGAAAGIAALVLYVLIYSAVFGKAPFPTQPGDLLAAIFAVAGGFNGARIHFRPHILVILCCAGYVFVEALRSIFGGKSARAASTDAAIAAMILLIMIYYVSRPLDENSWTAAALYMLFLAPAIADQTRTLLAVAVAGILVVPISAKFNARYLADPLQQSRYAVGWRHGCADEMAVEKPDVYCKQFLAKAEALKAIAAQGSLIYFSDVSFAMRRMTGISPSLPAPSMSASAKTNAELSLLAARIDRLNPRFILRDSDGSFGIPPAAARRAEERLLTALQFRYCARPDKSGWRVLERLPGDAKVCPVE